MTRSELVRSPCQKTPGLFGRVGPHLPISGRLLHSSRCRHPNRDPVEPIRSGTGLALTEGMHPRRVRNEEGVMNKDQVLGKWHELKGAAKAQWGKLTDDDVDQVEGPIEKLIGIICGPPHDKIKIRG